MIKTIIFDLGGVLVSLDREKCLENFSRNLGFDNFGDYLNAYAQKGFFAKYENGDIDSVEFREEIKKRCTRENVQDEEIDQAFFTFLTHVDTYKVKLLMELKKKIGVPANYRPQRKHTYEPVEWVMIRDIRFKGLDEEDTEWVMKRCHLKENDFNSMQRIKEAAQIIVANSNYPNVSYQLLKKKNGKYVSDEIDVPPELDIE